MSTYLVKFGPRLKKVKVELEEHFSFKYCLERAVRKLMASDPFMKQYASSGFFMTYKDEVTEQASIEVDEFTSQFEIDNNHPIEIMRFDSIDLDIPTRQQHTQQATVHSPAPTSAAGMAPRRNSQQTVGQHAAGSSIAMDYMDRIGLTVHKQAVSATEANFETAGTSNKASTSGCQRSQRSSSQLPSTHYQVLSSPKAPARKRTITQDSDDEVDDSGEYLENVLKQVQENKRRLEMIIPPEAPKLRPAKNKQPRKKGKENVEPRVMPSRAAKNKTVTNTEIEKEQAADKEILEETGNEAGLLSRNQQKIVQIKTVGHFHKPKDHRQIGEYITEHTPLPEFPKKLKASLEKGVYNTRLMNAFLKAHIKQITKKSTIRRSEYQILATKVSKRFQAMNLAHADSYMVKIRKKLSDSLRATRYYPKKKAKRAAERARANQTNENGDLNQSIGEEEVEEAADEADDVLQKPVMNKQSVKMCISASTKRVPFIINHTVQEVLVKYPYLKEADLLIYEYSNRVPMPLRILEENFNSSLLPLSHILNEPLPETDNEYGKIYLFHCIEKFYGAGDEHLPSIQFCNTSNRNAVPLNNIPLGQAPAVVIAQDGKMLQSATLIFDGSILTVASSPSAFDCVALLLSGYWVFHINYPGPYMQHMETIEAIIHGNTTRKARSVTRYPKMDEFFRKLIIATDSAN